MASYSIFYSWQSDVKSVRNLISDALGKAAKALSTVENTIEIIQDSREGNGAENISVGLLNSIIRSDLFIGDITPVTEYTAKDGIKIAPNSNVMFEYGFALRHLGESRCRQIAFLKDDQSMSKMPFDISQRKTIIVNEGNKKNLTKQIENWIIEKIEEIDNDRKQAIPEKHAYLSFENDARDLTIHPIFERISYYPKLPSKPKRRESDIISSVVKGSIDEDWLQRQIDRFSGTQYVKAQVVPMNSETIYESRVPINLFLSNIGKQAIENIEIIVRLSDESKGDFHEENRKKPYDFPKVKNLVGSLFIDENKKRFHISYGILNPGMEIALPTFYIKPPFEPCGIELNWVVSCKTFASNGTLIINSEPQYEDITSESNTKANTTEYRERIIHK